MITTVQLARVFETDLNALLDYENLSFKLWANVGERKRAERDGNIVQSYINGDIKVSASSMTANRLVMGVNSLTIEFDVPTEPPKTTVTQTAADLAPVKNGQFWFVQEIIGILSQYFQKYQALELQDSEGVTYAVGIVAGVAIPQGVDLNAWQGNSVPVNVYVDMNIVQGGVVSLDIGVELDGIALPFQSFVPDRSGVLDAVVYSGNSVSKVLTTSTAFAAEATIPTNSIFSSSASAVSYLLHGNPNEAHFLKIKWGAAADADTEVYLVTFTRATGGLQGTSIASVTFRIAEVTEDTELIEVPNGFQIGYFEVPSSTLASITLSVSADCLGYIARQAYELTAGQSVTIPLTPKSIVYDDDTEEYRIYMITSAAVTVAAEGYAFEVL